MEAVAQLAPLVIIALLFWLLLIRPAQRRQREQQAIQRSAGPGARVMLTSGIFGTVASYDEEDATLQVEIAPGTVIKVARAAVASILDDGTEEPADEAEAHDASTSTEQ